MKYILLFSLSFLLVIFSLWIPKEIQSLEEFSYIELGLPFSFVVQNKSLYFDPPASHFPATYSYGSPWEQGSTIIDFSGGRFTLSVCLVYVLLQLFMLVIFKINNDEK